MVSKICHLPVYNNFFQHFLVEELVFYESPFAFHFGKCSVIGKLSVRDGFHYLQNILLKCLDKEYRLKTGAVEIFLLQTHSHSNPSFGSNGSFYEVYGETMFAPKHKSADLNALTKTIKEMIIKLRLKTFTESAENNFDASDISFRTLDQVNGNERTRDVKEFEAMHVPAIQVDTMKEIYEAKEAEELIQTNLRLRRLRVKEHHGNY